MGYIVHGILQARILEWLALPFSRGSSQPRDWTQVSCTSGGFLPAEPRGKPKNTGVDSLSHFRWIFLTQESNWGLLHFRRILYQLSYKGSLITSLTLIKWPPCVYVLWSVTCWFLLKLTLGLFIWHALANWTIKTWLKQGLKKSLLSISAPISFDPFIFFSEDMYRQFRWKWDMWTRA